ncbi:hypothetical protein PUR59_00710, partial [Streptomyces sp. SP18ES09]|nr:hypothetical protein [Streptomyces sp. SP18ES09]
SASKPPPHHGLVPANAMEPSAPVLARTGWTVTASDEETSAENARAANVLDGDPATVWHSRWSGTPAPLPHSITVDRHRTERQRAVEGQRG